MFRAKTDNAAIIFRECPNIGGLPGDLEDTAAICYKGQVIYEIGRLALVSRPVYTALLRPGTQLADLQATR